MAAMILVMKYISVIHRRKLTSWSKLHFHNRSINHEVSSCVIFSSYISLPPVKSKQLY